MTYEEKVAMYMRCSKKELVVMLLENIKQREDAMKRAKVKLQDPLEQEIAGGLQAKTPPQRHFLLSFVSTKPDGSMLLKAITFSTSSGHPTYRDCLNVFANEYPDHTGTILTCISELKQVDYDIFISKQ